MTAAVAGVRRSGRFIGSRLGRFWSGISSVSIKELRGRMRGRRAFAVLTIYLLLLGLFSFAIYIYLKQQATLTGPSVLAPGIPRDFPGFPMPNQQTLSNGTALSAAIGHGIFGGLLFLETLLVLVLAPAFTTGAISLEREKQTLDMLVTTPLSSLGMVIGKLFSALTYVFLLIIASIPLASLVFVFGGVGPEDLIRAYVFLFALAFGMGALGLFISAIVKRTQTATVVTFVLVLVLSIGTTAAHQFWQMTTRPSTTSVILAQRPGKAPEAVLWLNPFVADLDMVCATAPDTYHASCEYISGVVNKPYFGTPTQTNPSFPVFEGDGPAPMPMPAQPGVVIDDVGLKIGAGEAGPAVCAEGRECFVSTGINAQAQVSFGFPRDTFWPKSALAFTILGIALTLASAQLVSPTRRLRLRRPGWLRIRGRRNQIAISTSVSNEAAPAVDEPTPLSDSTSEEAPEKTE